MSKFKVGDWVRHNGQVYNLEWEVEDGSIIDDEAELWQPKEGEWCWFKGVIDINYNEPSFLFGRYNYDNFFRMDGLEHQIEFTEVEPFIGTLPSFIKDK